MLGFRSVSHRSAATLLGRLASLIAAVMLLLPVTPALAQGADAPPARTTCGPDFVVADGHFFTQTAAEPGLGFDVIDDQQAGFWTAFRELGGVPALGYPITGRFQLRGFTVQAFQKAVLQWDPMKQGVNVANTLDTLHEAGADPWLEAFRQVPPHLFLPADDGATFDQVIRNHLALLETNPAIRDAFLATPDWLTRLGLPISYADLGAVRVLRAQRAVFQQWTADVPWAKAGEVIFANAGDLAKEAGLFPVAATAPSTARPPASLAAIVTLSSASPPQGATVHVALDAGHADAALGWMDRRLPLACAGGRWHALVGLSSTATPGAQPLTIEIGDARADAQLTVTPGSFPSTVIDIPDDLLGLLDPELARQEGEFFRAVVGTINGPPRWQGPFRLPVDGRRTSPFGERRTLEPGSVATVHEGLDLAAPLGTPVSAPNAGVVAWAGPLTIRGNVVVIDHGFGVFSAFFHLDRVDVVVGNEISTSQVIGTVGSTGRSTGPHLHWEVLVLGAAVDPDEWVRGDFTGISDSTAYLAPDAALLPAAGETPPAPAPGEQVPLPEPSNGEAQPGATTPPGGAAPPDDGSSAPSGDTGVPPAEGPAG